MFYKKGLLKILFLILLVIVLILGLTKWHIEKTEEEDELPEYGRVIDVLEENPNDKKVLEELRNEGNPFTFNEPGFERSPTGNDPNFLLTQNYQLGSISFKYPPAFAMRTINGNTISLKHTIDSPEHYDFCDQRGISGSSNPTLNTIDDFSVEIGFRNKSAADVLRDEVMSSWQDDFVDQHIVNGKIVVSEGFIDNFDIPVGNGFKIFTGAEGCGRIQYIVPLPDDSSVLITRELIPYLNPIHGNMDEYLALPGVISPTREQELFTAISHSIRFYETVAN